MSAVIFIDPCRVLLSSERGGYRQPGSDGGIPPKDQCMATFGQTWMGDNTMYAADKNIRDRTIQMSVNQIEDSMFYLPVYVSLHTWSQHWYPNGLIPHIASWDAMECFKDL